jgi:RNA polymerase-binding transcription factor
MNKKTAESFEQLLRNQRNALLQKFKRVEEDLGSIAEDRESELEECAQEERSARLLASLDDRTVNAVREIDDALARLADGTYGICEGCDEKIPPARLRVLPATRFCTQCSGKEEIKRSSAVGTRSFEQVILDSALP